jgi:putative transposase
MDDSTGRKQLPHDFPSWLNDPSREIFFLTICAKERNCAPLIQNDIAARLLDAVRFYQDSQRWWTEIALVMPDHLHLLTYFSGDMASVVRSWKRWTARHLFIRWQRDFFDHRLRNEEKWSETADYILQNPIRAGLVKDWRDWPHVWRARA